MPFIETSDRTSLFYKDWGTGKPVLFLHGWCLGANMWEYQMTLLADRGLRCIAYDVRGCGRSDQPGDRKSTRLNSSHANISYAVFCLKKNNTYYPFLPLAI